MPSPVPVWSCLPASCSRSSLEARRLPAQLSQGGHGRQRGGKRSLRTVRVHSRRIRQPALSLQRQPHCSSCRDERGETKEGCGETDGRDEKKEAAALIPPPAQPQCACPSGCLPTFPPLHVPSVGCMPPLPLRLPSLTCPSPPPPAPPTPPHLSDSLFHHPLP